MVTVLLRVFLLFVLVWLALRAAGRFLGGLSQGARGAAGPRGARGPQHREAATPVKMAKDPICGTFVVPGKALSATSDGTTTWFCSERCRDEFARRG